MQFKSQYQQEIDRVVYTNSGVKYHQYIVGMKGSYHLMPLIERIANKKLKRFQPMTGVKKPLTCATMMIATMTSEAIK